MNISIKGKHLIFKDANGSELSLSLESALDLLDWLQEHEGEILDCIHQGEQLPTHAVIRGLPQSDPGLDYLFNNSIFHGATGRPIRIADIARNSGTTPAMTIRSLIGMAEKGFIEVEFFTEKSEQEKP